MKVNNFIKLLFASMICGIFLIFIRIYEANFLEEMLYYQFDAKNQLVATCFIDLRSSIIISVILFPFLLFFKNTEKLIIGFYLLIYLSNVLLFKFFTKNISLLGNELFNFNIQEIFYIINTEKGTLGYPDIVLFIVAPLLFIFISKKVFKVSDAISKKIKTFILIIYFVVLFFVFRDYKYYFPSIAKYSSYHKYLINFNKLDYFLFDLLKNIDKNNVEPTSIDLKKSILRYQKSLPNMNFVDSLYPLLHNTEYENTLGIYFKKKEIKPNIVILMVESLSSSFSGKNAHLGSFTPFLDSLKSKSLSWENFLSNADRTYGVLPNTLSSAPFYNSFVSNSPYKDHNSLIKELNKYDYHTTFNYGGWSNFSKMKEYLIFNHIDEILADNAFDTTIFNIHKSYENDFHWGYDDGDLLKQYLIHSDNFKTPYLSIILTISMHGPYDVSKDFSMKDAYTYLGDLTKEQQKLAEVHPKKIRAIAFDDKVLKDFFAEYKKREDFENTIFLIYGDHNIQSLPVKNELDIFHTPFIIYSDLLVKPENFKAVVTQRDITPSLLALLEGNYSMKFTKNKHWLSTKIDTFKNFRCDIFSPMVLGSSKFVNFIYKQHAVYNNEVYIITDKLDLVPENNKDKKDEILDLYKAYIEIENYTFETNKLYKE